MTAPVQDIRFAFRQLRKAPGFSLTVVLTLALGIGATTAIFSLVEGILLRPLPFHDPNRLVLLGDHLGNSPNLPVTAREIRTYATATTAYVSMGAFLATDYELAGQNLPEEIHGARLNASVFPTLGVVPSLGRVFTVQDEDAHQPFVVISDSLWLNRYHRDPAVLGTAITLDHRNYTVVGVMPRNFEFPLVPGRLDQAQLWVPLSLTADDLSDANTGLFGFHIVARLKDGVTFAQAAQDTDRVSKQVMRDYPSNMSAIHIRGDVRLLSESLVADARPLLRALFLAVSVVLIIACVNVAVLLLVRALRRRREHAVRLALGAPPHVLIREALCEGTLLSLTGGLLGLVLAAAALRTTLHLLPDSMPRLDGVSINPAVALFALALAVATGVLCSAAPAWAATHTNLLVSLKDDARAGSGSAHQGVLRSTLVIAEIAIALVLLTVSGAFVRSYQKMLAVDPGFRADHVLLADYQLSPEQYPTGVDAHNFNREVLQRLGTQPSVLAVGIGNTLPATNNSSQAAYTVEGVPLAAWKLKFAQFTMVDGDYFRALDIPLIAGRYFDEHDRADAPLVVIVNQTMAHHFWPGRTALGKRMHVGNPHKGLPWATVVGVVADTKIGSPDQPADDQWYFPLEQPAILGVPSAANAPPLAANEYVVLRSTLPPEQMQQTLRTVVAGIDPQLALNDVGSMTDALVTVEAPRRFNTRLIAVFALAALLLAAMGIYAVMAFSVSLRTQEIAIRMALGARRVSIARLILQSSAKIALIGCVLGVLGSLAIARLVDAFLFGVSGTNPLIYSASVVIMLLLALCASALPAHRAASGDPARSLRAG
jgi:putative ABC transport system permease protein